MPPSLYISSGHELTGPFERAKTWVTRLDEFGNKAHESKEQQAKMAKMTPEQQRNYEKAQIRQDMQNKNSQRTFSLLAVWRGGKSPLGVLPGNSKERDFLPVAYADYIFAIIVEESGVIGAAFLMFLFLAILFRACYVSSRFDDFASMLMMMGLALMLTCQALISMMVVVGLGPVTGQPLPLITRGGTSAIVTSLYFGIMMCVSREQTMLRKRVSGTEEESKNDIPELLIMEPETKEPEPAPEPGYRTRNNRRSIIAMKYLISGGGTGGHIFPAVSIANALRELDPEAEILFVGALGRMEMERVPEAGYKIVGLPVRGFNRTQPWKNVSVVIDLLRSMRQAKRIIRDFRPDVGVGVGGYASGAAMKVAARMGVPILLQEQNGFAGVTNKAY